MLHTPVCIQSSYSVTFLRNKGTMTQTLRNRNPTAQRYRIVEVYTTVTLLSTPYCHSGDNQGPRSNFEIGGGGHD